MFSTECNNAVSFVGCIVILRVVWWSAIVLEGKPSFWDGMCFQVVRPPNGICNSIVIHIFVRARVQCIPCSSGVPRHLPILWERPNCATWCCMHLSYPQKTCSKWQFYLDQLRNLYKVTQNIHIPWCFQLIVIAQWLMKPQCCCKSKIGNMYNRQSTSDFHMNKRIYMRHITYDIILSFQRTDAEWRIYVCTRPPFVHIMACHLICTKRLSTPMPCYC